MINNLLKSKKNPRVFLTFRAKEGSFKTKKFYYFSQNEVCFHIQINNMNLPYDNIYKVTIPAKEDLKFSLKNLEEERLTLALSYNEDGLFEILFLYENFSKNELLSGIFTFSQKQSKELCSFYGKENLQELLQSLDENAREEFLEELRKREFEVKF